MEMSSHGQAVCITPFTLSGAMSPVTIAGALAQQNAEALAVIAFTQMVRAGAPVIYGGFTSNVDMRSGSQPSEHPNMPRLFLLADNLRTNTGCPIAPRTPMPLMRPMHKLPGRA